MIKSIIQFLPHKSIIYGFTMYINVLYSFFVTKMSVLHKKSKQSLRPSKGLIDEILLCIFIIYWVFQHRVHKFEPIF